VHVPHRPNNVVLDAVLPKFGDGVRGGVEFGAAGADHFNNELQTEAGIRQRHNIAIGQHIPGRDGFLRAARGP